MSMSKTTTAVYPGTFDPPTLGHVDIIKRASSLYDEVIVAASLHSKKSPLFSIDERLGMLEKITAPFGNVRVKMFDTLLVDFAASQGAQVIIRGLRASPDFDYEFQMAQYVKDQHPSMEMLYLMATRDILHISASAVRELLSMGATVASYVPPEILPNIQQKLALKKGAA